MGRSKQLSLFDEEPLVQPPTEPLAPFEFEPESAAVVPPPQRLTSAQRRIEEQRFDELSVWLQASLQPFFVKPVVVKRMYGKTRYVAMKQEGQEIVLRIHRRFIDAPEGVRKALIGWLKGPRRKAPKLVDQFIHELSTLIAAEQRLLPPRTDLQTQGQRHNLEEIYKEVNEKYFGGACRVAIGWGRKAKVRAQSRHLGSYSSTHHRIIINPILDSQLVPRFIVAFVIYHELLHSRQPPGTRRPHDKSFRDAEQSHPDYRLVKEWEHEKYGFARL